MEYQEKSAFKIIVDEIASLKERVERIEKELAEEKKANGGQALAIAKEVYNLVLNSSRIPADQQQPEQVRR